MVNVVADDREPEDLRDYLDKSTSMTVTTERLPIGDYIGGGAAIERKTPTDLSNSLGDRFFGQMQDLADNYEHPVLILHGHPWQMFAWARGRAQRKHYGYLGALARTVSMGVSVLVAFDDREFRSFVAKVCDKAGTDPDFERPISVSKRGRDLADVRNDVLCAVDGVSRERADGLLDQYQTIAAIGQQPPKTLQDVEGIGKKTAWNIYDALSGDTLDRAEFRADLADNVNGVTRQTADGLIDLFGDADTLAQQSADDLQRLDGVGPATAEAVLEFAREQ